MYGKKKSLRTTALENSENEAANTQYSPDSRESTCAVLSMTMGCLRLFKQMTGAVVVSGLDSLLGLVPHL